VDGRKVVAIVIVGLVGIGAVVGLRSRSKPSVIAAARPDAGTTAASASARPRELVPAHDAPPSVPAPPPQALDRDDEVQTKVAAVLDKYPDVASLKQIECQPTGACEIQILVTDLHNFRAPLELLQDPESGLSGDHKLMILSKPDELGPPGKGPWLFHFQLTPPQGGVVAPAKPAPPAPAKPAPATP
jgi:hypothetical protein